MPGTFHSQGMGNAPRAGGRASNGTFPRSRRVRLSDADREHLYERLAQHAAEGRLGLDELERRVEALAKAETREEAAAVLGDLPPLPANVGPAAGPAGAGARRRRGHGHADRPAPDWQPTNERFRDPRTNQVMRVWVDSAGGRHYVPE